MFRQATARVFSRQAGQDGSISTAVPRGWHLGRLGARKQTRRRMSNLETNRYWTSHCCQPAADHRSSWSAKNETSPPTATPRDTRPLRAYPVWVVARWAFLKAMSPLASWSSARWFSSFLDQRMRIARLRFIQE